MKTRILATAAIALALAVGVSAPAFAEAYTGALSANSSAPGGTLTYTSDDTGEADGTSGSFQLTGDTAKAEGTVVHTAASVTHTVTVGANSTLNFNVKIPNDAKVGSVYHLTVSVGKFADQQSIKIVGVPSSVALAGFNGTILWIAIPVVIVVLLLLLVLMLRRRRGDATV